jgi:hypothetical protein
MSILSAIKQESNSLDDLAKLPQTLIMQMAQNGQISKEMVAPILGKKAEMADATARMRAMQQGGQQQSVMEQIMQKNAQGENPIPQIPTRMEETGVAQIPTREPQYAGGGIVAFDGGGMAMSMDDEDETYAEMVEDAKRKKMFSKLQGMLNDTPNDMPKSFADSKKDTQTAGLGSISAPERSGHPYEAEAIAAAKKVGLDPSIMLHALYKETGGIKDPATATSKAGAYGPMQLMAGTAKELGVNRKDPYENILGGATYLKQQLDTFKDPKLALAAYNAGPGAVRRALSSEHGVASLPRETHGYMRMADGGMVPGYAAGDYIDPASTLSPGEEIIDLPPGKKDRYEEFFRRQDLAHEERRNSAKEDRNLALLQAGLGMMAGTSPYAMANIGAGAMQGAQAYSAAKRARTQEGLLLDRNEINALKAKTDQESTDIYRGQLNENRKANRERLADEGQDRASQAALRNAQQNPYYKNYEKEMQNLDQTNPLYNYYAQEMQRIQDAYIKGITYVPAPKPVAIKEPGIWDRIKGGFSSLPVSPSPGVDTNNRLLK